MKKQNKNLLIKVFSILGDTDSSFCTKNALIKKALENCTALDNKEKNQLFRYFKELSKISTPEYLSRNLTIRDATKMVNRAERSSTARRKKKIIKTTLKDNREQRLPVIFYLCSYHEKCAVGHKEYQGKIYVDRYWKSAIEQYHELWWLIAPVQDYIKTNHVLTVQEVTGNDPYLIIRPYCKHFFIPIEIMTVLGSSVAEIKREHPEAVRGTGSKSNKQYRQDYYKLRNRIKEGLVN